MEIGAPTKADARGNHPDYRQRRCATVAVQNEPILWLSVSQADKLFKAVNLSLVERSHRLLYLPCDLPHSCKMLSRIDRLALTAW